MSIAAAPARLEAGAPPEARGLRRDDVRMLVAEGAAETELAHARARDLPAYLDPGDLLVVNASATLPAALPARRADGSPLRLHLSTPDPDGIPGRWIVELRRGGEPFSGAAAGERLELPEGASATLRARYDRGARLWVAGLDTAGRPLHDYLAEHGGPIRYGYAERAWPLADYQTIFASIPGSAEMPSAGRPFTLELLTALAERDVAVAPVVLHTGVSSLESGEPPYPERFDVCAETARLVNAARLRRARVVAVGTTVVRALETVARPDGSVRPGRGWTSHVVTPAGGVRAVDGLLTGWHDPDASHLLMLEAIGGPELVDDSYRAALAHGYRWHEFGDVHLILP